MGIVSVTQITMVFFGGSVFRTVPLEYIDFGIVMLLALLVIPIDMLRKLVVNCVGKTRGT